MILGTFASLDLKSAPNELPEEGGIARLRFCSVRGDFTAHACSCFIPFNLTLINAKLFLQARLSQNLRFLKRSMHNWLRSSHSSWGKCREDVAQYSSQEIRNKITQG